MLPARTVLLLTLLLSFSLHHASAHFAPVECCFEYAQKPIRHPQSFYRTSKDCPKPAVVIVAASGDEICADPKKSWVKKMVKRLQAKNNPSTV
ncbi:C-C motif chemokine 17-like [Malurus melanocephalus]|uniref:C-C motif chemokine 17-like n=1 Tax=Malurus melanocephalus TaxID=175006 RepID=UPI002548A7F0|nr:C-C motif chemokine 17-like [Malurus melanocephalus]